MNGVLPSVTWGTWDDHAWICERNEAAQLGGPASAASPSSPRSAVATGSARGQRKLERRGLRAPKQSQLWFEEVLDRVDATPFAQAHGGYKCNPLRCLHAPLPCASQRDDHSSADTSGSGVIPWDTLPDGIHPRDGKLPPERVRKKRHQVENLAVFLQRLLQPGDVVVEFCAGSGYVALPLACMFPECTFVILDKKEPSLAIAQERIAAAGLGNVEIFCGFIDDYKKSFDVGIALHACGEATDMVMQQCLDAHAAFVLAPCCVGKIKLSALQYPRSAALRSTLPRAQYEVLARAADFGHSNDAMCLSPVNVRRRRCKTLLESDRNALAAEHGYATYKFVMHPHDATPKNDVLVGVPPVADRDASTDARGSKIGNKRNRTLRLECMRNLDELDTRRTIFGLP